jgi:hypothetical protein
MSLFDFPIRNLWRRAMKMRTAVLVLVVAVLALVGCKKAEPTPAVEAVADARPRGGPRGLDGVNGLALGTLRLEETEDALTPAQAAELLPLWQIIQSGSLQGDAETEAVLKQIEGKMTEAQLASIEAMELTFQDMGVWMEAQGIEMPARPQGQQGGGGPSQNMSEEERNNLRQELQNMTQEQRATRMAEMGFQRPEGGGQGSGPGGGGFAGRGQGGGGQFSLLLEPLIELLTERATQ